MLVVPLDTHPKKPSYRVHLRPRVPPLYPLPYSSDGAACHRQRRSLYAGTLVIQYLHNNADPPPTWISLSFRRILHTGSSFQQKAWSIHADSPLAPTATLSLPASATSDLVAEWGIIRPMPDERIKWRKYGYNLTKSATQYRLLESVGLDPVASSQTTRGKYTHVSQSLSLSFCEKLSTHVQPARLRPSWLKSSVTPPPSAPHQCAAVVCRN